MQKNRTIKRDFYLLVIKVFLLPVISTLITYAGLIIFIYASTDNTSIKTSNYYEKQLDLIEKDINKNSASILKGSLIDLKKYSENIEGEVLDVNGNHMFGTAGILDKNIDFYSSINRNIVKGHNIYKFICIRHGNSIDGIYVLKAPFGFSINNMKDNPQVVVIYRLLLAIPIIYFIFFLILFTTKLYKSIWNNIKKLLDAATKITNGNFDFKVEGLKGEEFNRIQTSFNEMISALKEMVTRLAKIDEERRMMVSSIAHDIRSPLTVINGQMELIEEMKSRNNFDISPHLHMINRSCVRMATLMDNLSLLYKVEKVGFLLKIQKTNLYKMLKEKKDELAAIVDTDAIAVNFEIKLSKDYYLLDESMLLRILDNILFNSIRFTKKGEIRLEVHDEEGSPRIYFKCIDTGAGFKQKDTSLLFEAFYQDESYRNHFGLGLYISKKIVNSYGGEILAYNSEKGGAVVEFYINELANYE